MELAIAGSIAGTAKVVEPCQHRQQAVQIFETAQITLGEIGLLGCHRSPPANMTVKSCAESNAQISCRTGVESPPFFSTCLQLKYHHRPFGSEHSMRGRT